MTDSFTCSICGQVHVGLVTDYAYKLPDEVWAIPEDERKERARFNSDLCQFGGRNFIRCVLEIPFTANAGFFGWGAWAEVDWPTFERYLELYDEDGTSEPARAGTLANSLPAYSETLGLPVLIQFRDPKRRPLISLEPEDDSNLAKEQRNGIGEARYREILHRIKSR